MTAIFGGGCFWCTEAVFKGLRGVKSVVSGYAGGDPSTSSGQAPTYEEVSEGNTGHAEVIKIDFDPEKISYGDLLTVFFFTHNPTTPNQQGNDKGEQYRSVIFYEDEEQKTAAENFIKNLVEKKAYESEIVTQVLPVKNFFPAEGYHQDYYARNKNQSYCELVIEPKLEKLQKKFADLLA